VGGGIAPLGVADCESVDYNWGMIRRTLEAVYENGVLRPLEPLDLHEHQHVAVVVSELPATHSADDLLDLDYLRSCAREVDNNISLEAVRKALASIPEALTSDFAAERDEA
jgi:predicted DNA-binding antitoxin AbrB/MazE fold protein